MSNGICGFCAFELQRGKCPGCHRRCKGAVFYLLTMGGEGTALGEGVGVVLGTPASKGG